ncbi:MAG: hypothetical protein ACRCSO_01460 [Sphingomonas sp.]
MFTRIFSLALCLAVTACSRSDASDAARFTRPTRAPDSGGIACAHQGAALAAVCTVERTPTQDGAILTLRHPDGGFRRLKITRDGRGVIAADGAERARVRVVGAHEIEVALAGDRYRLPATVGQADAR